METMTDKQRLNELEKRIAELERQAARTKLWCDEHQYVLVRIGEAVCVARRCDDSGLSYVISDKAVRAHWLTAHCANIWVTEEKQKEK